MDEEKTLAARRATSGMLEQKAVKEASPIEAQVTNLAFWKEELHAAVRRLENRLQPVLAPANDTLAAETSAPTRGVSDLHNTLGEHTYGIREAVEKLQDITHRIEL